MQRTIIPRYDWLVDNQPAQQSFTPLGDVSGCIDVAVESQPTGGTIEIVRFPYSPFSTPRTILAGVFGRNLNQSFSFPFQLVCQKLSKLPVCPPTKLPVEIPPKPFLLEDVQVFQSNNVEIHSSYLLRQDVIGVCLKPSFPLGEFLEFPLCRAGANRLQFLSKVCIATFDVPYRLGIEKDSIGEDSGIDNTSIDAKNFCLSSNGFWGWSGDFYDKVDSNLPILDIEPEGRNLSINISLEVFWDMDRNLFSSINGRNREKPTIQEWCESTLIVSDGRKRTFLWESATPISLKHVSGAVPCTLNERCLEMRPAFPSIVVPKFLELVFEEGLVVKSKSEKEVATFIELTYGGDKDGRRWESQCDGPLHNSPILLNLFNCSPIPPMSEGMGFLGGI